MAKEIAVFVGPDGSSALLEKQGKVVVFRLAQGAWEIDREMDVSMGEVKGMRELRQHMAGIVRFLGECRVFVARSATGIPYFELEKAGCSIWEYTGRPADFLGQVWEQEVADRAAEDKQAATEIPAPEERSPGNYFISVKEIQSRNADVSSKQVLREFIRRGGFRSLLIVCGHIPPWVEAEAMRGRLRFEAEQVDRNEYTVKISKC